MLPNSDSIEQDDAVYSVEIVPPERDELGAKYALDLVRNSVDSQGLGREQRLTLGQHNSWMEADEHLGEIEQARAEDGLEGWGDDVQRLHDQPYTEEVFYLAVTYPPDAPESNTPATTHLLAIGEHGVHSAELASGERESMERVVDHFDLLQAEEGIDPMLESASLENGVNTGGASTTPLFQPDAEAVRHVDSGGTAHWFAVVAHNDPEHDPYELRYFRELELENDTPYQDSYPVMPLPDNDPTSAWALPGLEMYLQKGDVFMAQQFAHDVADAYGQDFPKPLDLPSLDPRPEYYFGYGISDNNEPSLEAVKTWMTGGERRFDTLTLGEYGTFDEVAVDERELETLMDEKGVEVALNLAESMAVAGGYLDPERDDPRIFFEDDAPSDPFTTNLERELADPSYSIGAISANGESFLDVTKTWGQDQYERLVIPQPNWENARENAIVANDMLAEDRLDDAMRLVETAGIEAGVIDLQRDDPRLFTQGPLDTFQTMREEEINDNLARYGVTWREAHEWATEAEQTPEVEADLEDIVDNRRVLEPLDPNVNYALVVQTDDPDKLELALEKSWQGTDGVVETASQTLQTYNDYDLALADRDALMDVYDERGLQAMMNKAELQATKNEHLDPHRADLGLFDAGPPDRFTTLAQQLEGEVNPYWNVADEIETAVENPYWRLDTIPVNDPEGEPLGHALHMVVYDGVAQNPDQIGTPTLSENEPFRMLEMAHFETAEAADKFGKDFKGYLIPDVLEGPELAEEVAKLEGHSVDWKALEGDDLKAYQDGELTLTREPSDWKPYNPNAERDARIETEGLTIDPSFTIPNENVPKVEAVSPDLDL